MNTNLLQHCLANVTDAGQILKQHRDNVSQFLGIRERFGMFLLHFLRSETEIIGILDIINGPRTANHNKDQGPIPQRILKLRSS